MHAPSAQVKSELRNVSDLRQHSDTNIVLQRQQRCLDARRLWHQGRAPPQGVQQQFQHYGWQGPGLAGPGAPTCTIMGGSHHTPMVFSRLRRSISTASLPEAISGSPAIGTQGLP